MSLIERLGPVVFSCRRVIGPERMTGARHPRLQYYSMLLCGSAFLAIYGTLASMYLVGHWPLQPQHRPVAWVYFVANTVVIAWIARSIEGLDKLVVHENGFRYVIGIFWRGKILYEDVREIEVGRGLDFDRLGALKILTRSDIIQAGRRFSTNSAIVKTQNGKLKVMHSVLIRFSADDLARWLEAASSNCAGRIRFVANA